MHRYQKVFPRCIYGASLKIPVGKVESELNARYEYIFLPLPIREMQVMVRFASLLSADLPKMYLWCKFFDVVVQFHLSVIADKIYGNHCAPWSVEILIKYAFP